MLAGELAGLCLKRHKRLAGLALLLDEAGAHLGQRLEVARSLARLVEIGLRLLGLRLERAGLLVELLQARLQAGKLGHLHVLLGARVEQARHLLAHLRDTPAVARLYIMLASLVERGLRPVQAGHVVGLVDEGVQAVAQTRRGDVGAEAVLPHEDALLEGGAVQAEHPLTRLGPVQLHGPARLDVDHLALVRGMGRPEGAHDAQLLPRELHIERAAVLAAGPGLVAQAVVLAHVALALAVQAVQHRLDVGGDGGLAPAVGLHDHVEPLVEAQCVVLEGAETRDMALDEPHYSTSPFPLRAFQPQRTMRDFSLGLSESSPWT